MTAQPGSPKAPHLAPMFLAHGSPMLALTPIPAHHFLRDLGQSLPRPKGIVILSPHWETQDLRITSPGTLKTIHDFGGFPRALFEIQYPAHATRQLVDTVKKHALSGGFSLKEDGSWGLDHGAWVPLSLLFPKLDVPVVELSLPYDSTPASIHALGRSLAALTEQGILILGSGSTTHNLREIQPEGSEAAGWAKAFDAWVDEGLEKADIAFFADPSVAPNFRRAHPTAEHFLPLFFAMGAAGKDVPADLLHRSYSHGTLSMSYFSFPQKAAA
ncbi:dioxygenase family protein [Roseibium litorale]|uniref:Dioxygenase n=1 Tax=Roseibium litorale TaxID=2803841 RepID=A0ABR9CME3_9HYPH|nr:class III extradiol ring-cleavage dioxygenase [Roseibium litorale]MBD8891476.1 dioxygenase [Roseibium litorale]